MGSNQSQERKSKDYVLANSYALQLIFQYFDEQHLIQMQLINRRFYDSIIPGLVSRVQSIQNEQSDMFGQMRQQQTKVMAFVNNSHFFVFSRSTQYKWSKVELSEDSKMKEFPVYWPKIADIGRGKYLLVGGSKPISNFQPWIHGGQTHCCMLDINDRTLKKKSSLPSLKIAHQVCFLPPRQRVYKFRISSKFGFNGQWIKAEDLELHGTVFCIGGKTNHVDFSTSCYKYSVGQDKWSKIASIPVKSYSMSLVPILEPSSAKSLDKGRRQFIYAIGGAAFSSSSFEIIQSYEVEANTWSTIALNQVKKIALCQIGAIPISQSEAGLELLIFGGIAQYGKLLDTTQLLKIADNKGCFSKASETLKGEQLPLHPDDEYNLDTLDKGDRFFYNYPFYMGKGNSITSELKAKIVAQLKLRIKAELDDQLLYNADGPQEMDVQSPEETVEKILETMLGKDACQLDGGHGDPFRFVAMPSREAFHIWDNWTMRWIYSDESQGYCRFDASD